MFNDDGIAARKHRYRRTALTVVGAVAAIPAVVGLVAHFRAPHFSPVIGVSAFAPYLMLGAPVALGFLVIARRWFGVAAASLLSALSLTTQAPLYVAAAPPPHARSVVTMTANLRLGLASPAAVVHAVRAHHVEVLMLEELTSSEQGALAAAGLNEAMPYHVSEPLGAALGTGLWSRYPLTDMQHRTDFAFAFLTARIAVPGVQSPPLAIALHMAGPWPDASRWNVDIAHLPSVLRSLGEANAMIVGGDFNATPDIAQFRRLLGDGVHDGAEQAGAGLTATYPADRWFPPLIAIDHVLTRNAVATTADTIEIRGSDHRALLVTVAVPTE